MLACLPTLQKVQFSQSKHRYLRSLYLTRPTPLLAATVLLRVFHWGKQHPIGFFPTPDRGHWMDYDGHPIQTEIWDLLKTRDFIQYGVWLPWVRWQSLGVINTILFFSLVTHRVKFYWKYRVHTMITVFRDRPIVSHYHIPALSVRIFLCFYFSWPLWSTWHCRNEIR